MRYLTDEELAQALKVQDLTKVHGHALQRIVQVITGALSTAWNVHYLVNPGSLIVSIEDNYDRLHYPVDGIARDTKYTRYINDKLLLRTQMSAVIPSALRELSTVSLPDILLAAPGLVYRRDCVDKLHTGEPHQLDLWRISRDSPPLTKNNLLDMVQIVVGSVLPDRGWRVTDAVHPYTTNGLQIDVFQDGEWVEIGECGLTLPGILEEAGYPIPPTSGLAMGLGLDRILMLRKGIDDIRLLKSTDTRVSSQMYDLKPYQPVSSMPAVKRDLSIATDQDITAEELGDKVRTALGDRARDVESVEVISETPQIDLPILAVQRLGMQKGQKNVLIRVVIRSLERTLTSDECNILRDTIYEAIHQGDNWTWITR